MLLSTSLMKLKSKLKLVGLLVGFIALLASFFNLLGFFADKEKLHLAQLIRYSEGGIPRETPGFEKFLSDFPPPKNISPDSITYIVKDKIQTHDKFTMIGVVRYLANNKRTEPVTTFEEVDIWSKKTNYGWISLIITILCWTTVAVVDLIEIFGSKK